MITVFGKVEEGVQPAQTETSIDDCVKDVWCIRVLLLVVVTHRQTNRVYVTTDCTRTCFSLPDCILAYVNPNQDCYLYNYTSTQELVVLETTRAEGQYVSFKTNSTADTCPASQEDVTLVVTIGVDIYNWNRTPTGWSFKKCMDDWKRFERADNVVCMQWFPMIDGASRTEAQQMCADKGAVLSGVASITECQWFHAFLLKLLAEDENYRGFWIDGVRNCSTDEPQCTNFDWTDGYTTGKDALAESNMFNSFVDNGGTRIENCLAITKNKDMPQTLNDASCVENISNWIIGAVCGYKLN